MTHFEQWLRMRGVSRFAFGHEHGIPGHVMASLAVPGLRSKRIPTVRYDHVMRISSVTGIRPGVLFEDAAGYSGAPPLEGFTTDAA